MKSPTDVLVKLLFTMSYFILMTNATTLRIIQMPVSAGDCALVIFPTGKLMMIDTGSKDRFVEVVLPFLRRHCVEHIDYLVKTHQHQDHVGGKVVLEMEGLIDSNTEIWDCMTFNYKDEFTLEQVNFFIYNVKDKSIHGENTNHNSLAFRMEFNGWVYTTGGDEGLKSMARFMKDRPNLVRANVRKMAHHSYGPLSTKFLRHTNADLYIATNRKEILEGEAPLENWREQFFPEVVDYLRNNGGKIDNPGYSVTGIDGFIYINATNKRKWEYTTDKYERRLGFMVNDWTQCTEKRGDAAYISLSVPKNMFAGTKRTASLTMANTGTIPWTKNTKFKLMSKQPNGNKRWGLNRVQLPNDAIVETGDDHIFSFTITAPSRPGIYDFQWQMVNEGDDGIGIFGSETHNIKIVVSEKSA